MNGTLFHQTADVVRVATQAIELRYQYWSAITLRPGQRLSKHRTLVCVVLAAFDLDEQLGDLKPSVFAKRCSAACWASRPRPERTCFSRDTLT
jgi:hypothetical protein